MLEEPTTTELEIKKKSKTLKIILGIAIAMGVVALVYLRYKNPEFPLFWVVFVGAVLGIVALFVFFGRTIVNFIKGLFSKTATTVGLPGPMTDEQLMEIADKIIVSQKYENHIKKFGTTIPYSSGKNLMKAIYCDLLYSHHGSYRCVVIINANDVSRYSVIFEGDKKLLESTIKFYANALSIAPEQEPDILEEETESPLTGIKTKKKQVIHREKLKKTEEEKEL